MPIIFRPTCPHDGYPLTEVASFEHPNRKQCSNSWCPTHPGKCPKCGSRGFHDLATDTNVPGDPECVDCGHVWKTAAKYNPLTPYETDET